MAEDLERTMLDRLTQATPPAITPNNPSVGVPAHWLTLNHYYPMAPEARQLTDDIYRRAGVGINWNHVHPGNPGTHADPTTFIFREIAEGPKHMGGTAQAMVDSETGRGVLGTIFRDRMNAVTQHPRARMSPEQVEGLVLAHELGHLLGNRHTKKGLMQPKIDARQEFVDDDWQFDELQAELIRRVIDEARRPARND